MNELTIAIISGLLILTGFIGTVLPLLPGPPISLAGLILYAWFTKFETVSVTAVVIFSLLTILTFLFDIFGPALAARGYKSSKWGAWGAIAGAIGGIMVMGPLGAFIGPFVGAFVGEYLATPNHVHAFRTAWGAFVGILIGTVFKLAVILSMLIYFIFAIIP